jgi:hypothetical protein
MIKKIWKGVRAYAQADDTSTFVSLVENGLHMQYYKIGEQTTETTPRCLFGFETLDAAYYYIHTKCTSRHVAVLECEAGVVELPEGWHTWYSVDRSFDDEFWKQVQAGLESQVEPFIPDGRIYLAEHCPGEGTLWCRWIKPLSIV